MVAEKTNPQQRQPVNVKEHYGSKNIVVYVNGRAAQRCLQ